MIQKKLISIICPVFNEEQAVPIFYQRLQAALAPLRERYDFELLFANNCSTDNTAATILRLREKDPTVQLLTLSRNFGYEANVATGLKYARGIAMAIIDVDCEDPPEMIPQFIAEWEKGFDVVYGKRDQRPEFIGMQLARKAFYRLNRLVADSDIVLYMAEFCLMSAAVRDAILDNHSTVPFLRTEVAYVGFPRKGISYARQPRVAGKSHYNLLRATKFAIAGILSSSTFPLRLSVYTFPFLVLTNLTLLYWNRFRILVAVDFLYIAFYLAVLCVYLARTYKDVVHRPVSVVDWRRSALDFRQ